MSFYFPIVTSGMKLKESERVVNTKLQDLYNDLEWLIHWENNYNQECRYEENPSNYVYLKNIIDTILKEVQS